MTNDLKKMLPELNAAQLKWLERYVTEQRIDELNNVLIAQARWQTRGYLKDRIATLKKEAGV